MTDSSDPRPAPGSARGTALTPTDTAETAPDYNPDDYRWVPVRRRQRYDGWTEEKQRRFIEVLADTGLVTKAAKAVGLSRESAHRLRRQPHAADFARAWDIAREHAAGLLEDIAFERAIEGVEQDIHDRDGNVVGAKLVHDSGMLKWLLVHLKPERYGAQATAKPPAAAPAPAPALEQCLRAMEPALPAPPEQLLDPETLAQELELADINDGQLPHFLREQRPPRTDAQIAADAHQARMDRGAAAAAKRDAGHELTDEEFADECYYIDPESNSGRRRRPRKEPGT
jgi:hypothetical protein